MLAALGVGALVAGGVMLLVAHRLDEEIRVRAEQKLAAKYPGLKVKVGSARVVSEKGIELRGIQLYEPGAHGPRAELLHVDEIFVECPTSMAELMADALPIKQITLRRPAASATLRADGTWSLARLFECRRQGDEPQPPVTIENGTIRIFDPQRQPASMYVLREINVRVDPVKRAREGEAPAEPALRGRCPDLRISGVAGGDHLQRIDVEGSLSGSTHEWQVRGRTTGLALGPELRDALPSPIASALANFGELRGRTEIDFSLASNPSLGDPILFSATATLAGGHLADPQLPVALTDIGATLQIDNRGWRIPKLTARQDQATLELSARREGFTDKSPTVVQLAAKQLRFDYRLVEALPPSIRSLWDQFRPSGVIDIQATLASDGLDWRGDLTVDCVETGFVYQAVPYPIRGGVGNVTLRNDLLTVNLRAFAGPQPITIQGRIQSPGANWHGWLDVKSAGPIPIDARVMAALPVAVRPIIESFEAHGGATVAGRIERPYGGQMVQTATLDLVGCDMRYQHFPYPLRDLTGRIELARGIWHFKNLAAHNGSAEVTCNGHWSPGPGGGRLELSFDAADVPLEHDLRNALPYSAQQAWAALGPQGSLDRLSVKLVREPGMAMPAIDVRATKLAAGQIQPGAVPRATATRGLAFAPSVAPYRFEQVTGTAHYRPGLLELSDLRATHGTTVVNLTAAAEILPDGRPRVILSKFDAQRVTIDRDLVLSLPESWRQTCARLGLAGQANIVAAAELVGPADWNRVTAAEAFAAAQARWDVSTELASFAINPGVPLSQIRGNVQFAGGAAQGRIVTRGELAIESLLCRDMPVTQVAGPFSIDNQTVAIGSYAIRTDINQPPRRAAGRVCGGVLALDAQASLLADGNYQLQTSLSDGNLAAMCQEMVPGSTNLRGRVFAGVEVAGSRQAADSHRGRGSFKVRDADLGELPVVLTTLKLLRSRSPDKTAFHTAEGEFDIAGEELVFRELRLEGDAVALKGQGTVGLGRDLNLTMHSVVSRNDIFAPILSPLLGEASRQILEIRLTGTLERPEIDSHAFPALKESLDRLFPELARRDKREPPPTNPLIAPLREGFWR